jgi:hypothetical protein
MWHLKGTGEVQAGFFWGGGLRESNRVGDIEIYGRIIFKWIFKKYDRKKV